MSTNYDVATVNELKDGLLSAYAQVDYENQLRGDIQAYEDEINKPYAPYKKGILGVAKEKSKALYWGLILLPVVMLILTPITGVIGFFNAAIYYWIGFAVLAWIVRKLQIDEGHASMVREMRAKQKEAQETLDNELTSTDRADRLNTVPLEMQNVDSISALFNILDSGRADSWKEALHVFDEMSYRARMEKSQQQLLEAETSHLANMSGLQETLAGLRAEVAEGNNYVATRDMEGRGVAAVRYAVNHPKKKGLAGWLGL